MKIISLHATTSFFLMALFALLSACGGGGSGNSSTPVTPVTPVPTAAAISVSTSATSVASDNSSTATITATVVNSSNAAVSGVTVTFSADSGFLSASSAVSDASGKATVTFSSGANATNRTATIVATASGQSSQVPVRITGSTLTVTATSNSLVVGASTSTLTVVAKNSAGAVLPGQTITLTPSTSGIVSLSAGTGVTDSSGTFTATVTPTTGGTVTITVAGVGETRTIALTVTGASTAFQITSPVASTTATPATLNTTIAFSVQAPSPTTSVTFVTTLGSWQNGSSVYTIAPTGGVATATLTSSSAGVANVQVFDTARQASISDTRVVSFTAACTAAAKVTLQSSPSIVAPSAGGTVSLSSLLATVTDISGNPVGGCPVAFRVVNATGGGETVAPAVVLTAAVPGGASGLGQATTTFTSGSLPSGAAGVQIRATVVQTSATVVATGTLPSGNDATVVIGGTAGSVTIGRSTVATDSGSGTLYILPMSVLVADSNGNPVTNAVVSLSAWPISFNVGGSICGGISGTYYFNEDANENLVRDPTETGARLFYPSGAVSTSVPTLSQLTPPNSAAGTLPATVTTNASGVATFNLTYTKSNAGYIIDRIRARTLVQGTETLSEIRFGLPYLASDAASPCSLANSPYQ